MPKILVIDDDDQLRMMLRQMLEREHYDVLDASNGAEGLDILKEEEVDLVVTDIFMPVEDGIGTIMQLYQDHPKVKVIAISGGSRNPSIDYLKLAQDLGAHKIFSKPLDRSQFIEAVRALLS